MSYKELWINGKTDGDIDHLISIDSDSVIDCLLEDVRRLQAENAELKKRVQKNKGAIKDLISDIRSSDYSRCNEVIDSHLFCGLNELLKGGSDE